MKISVQLQNRPQLTMTPTLTQAIGILALSYSELCEHIAQECAENPALECVFPQSASAVDGVCAQLADTYQPTMASYLEQSLDDPTMSPQTKSFLATLIEHIDERGFLPQQYRQALSVIQEKEYLQWVKNLEPVGIGAQDVYECLLWQIEQLPITPASGFLARFMQAVVQGECQLKDKQQFLMSEPEIESAVDALFATLELTPARFFSPVEVMVPSAEILLVMIDGSYDVQLNQAILPQVRVTMPRSLNPSAHQKAKSFQKMLQTRYQTLLQVSRYLVKQQQDFFHFGKTALRPLQLSDVAQALDLHESTISRIAQEKFLWTPQGFVPLKTLFARKVRHQDYGTVSMSHVQSCLAELIHHEDPAAPFSDQQLQYILSHQGYCLARRTIAKYREKMGFLSSRGRRLKSRRR